MADEFLVVILRWAVEAAGYAVGAAVVAVVLAIKGSGGAGMEIAWGRRGTTWLFRLESTEFWGPMGMGMGIDMGMGMCMAKLATCWP